jgi:hypothetical protein
MEFQSGPNAPLKPVQIIASQKLVESYVTFDNRSWKPYRHGLYS